MVSQKIKNKKAAQTTLTSIVTVMLLGAALFLGTYAFFIGVAGPETIVGEAEYAEAYEQLNTSIRELNASAAGVYEGFSGIFEPEEGTFAVWNGLRGLGKLFLLPLDLINVATDTADAVLLQMAFPGWLLTIIGILIFIIILFTLIGAAKGEQRM